MLDMQKFIDKAIYLSLSEFNRKFDELWENMTESFKKFECLQIYDEPGECPIYDLINKDHNLFSKKLKQNKILDKPFYISALSKGISMKKLHLIEFPISDYIKYEYYSYYLSNYLGEFIKYNDIKKYNNIQLKDFVIFDNK